MKAYPSDQLYEEMAFIAYYFHWPHAELMSLEHMERRRWCQQISHVNRRVDMTSNHSLESIATG